MATVEELRARLVDMELDSAGVGSEKEARELVNFLIVVARAEGFKEGVEDTTADLALVEDAETFARGYAEGVAQMADRVRSHGGHYTQKGDMVASEYISPGLAARATVDLFIVPAFVLAPKEMMDGRNR